MKLGHFFAKIIKIQSSPGLVSQPSPPALCMIMIPKYSGGATLHSDAETSQGNLSGENKFDLSLHIGQIGPRGKAAQPSPARRH